MRLPRLHRKREKMPRARIEYHEGNDGRWYWHRKSSGRVTADGSYAHERSLVRAMRRMYPDTPLIKTVD